MTPAEAINAISSGRLVYCSSEEKYLKVRNALREYAFYKIGSDDDVYAQIALAEIKRLDNHFQFTPEHQ